MTVIVCISSGELISECLVQLRMKSCDDTRDRQLEDAANNMGQMNGCRAMLSYHDLQTDGFNKSSSSGIVVPSVIPS
jgi:hypothetical protein